MRVSKQRGYRQLSVRAHVGDDARVNIYSSDQGGKYCIYDKLVFSFLVTSYIVAREEVSCEENH